MTPGVESTVVVQFKDGTFSVPVWWSRSLNMRTVTYADGVRVVDCSLDEMRKFVNTDMVDALWADAIRKQRSNSKR